MFFLYALFPDDVSRKFRNITGIITIILILVSIPGISLSYYISKPQYIYDILVLLYVYYVAIKAVINKRTGSRLFLIAFVIFSAGAINDILLMYEIIYSVSLVASGLIVFVILLSILQGRRMAQMYNSNLTLTHNLKILNIELEKKVQQRTSELNKTLENLKEYIKFKEIITSMIVHDLKIPLNVMLNMSKEVPPVEQNETLTYFARRMLNLVMNILDVNKYQHVKLTLHRTTVAIAQLCDTAIKHYQYEIIKKKHKTEGNGRCYYWGFC